MNPFGFTRSHTARNYALVAPESHVPAALPHWTDTSGIIVVSPAMGARFAQYFALMAAGGTAALRGRRMRLQHLRAGGHAPCHDGRQRMSADDFRKAL